MATKKPVAHRVLHNGVGPFVQGDTVLENKWPEGTDLERLIALGAIAPLSADQARAAEAGADATLGGTLDPLRTENPPTLPRPAEEGVPPTTTPIGGDVSGQPAAMSEADVKREARRR